MADQTSDANGAQVDFEHHARDYSLMIAMLKWGAIAAFIIAIIVMIIIAS